MGENKAEKPHTYTDSHVRVETRMPGMCLPAEDREQLPKLEGAPGRPSIPPSGPGELGHRHLEVGLLAYMALREYSVTKVSPTESVVL